MAIIVTMRQIELATLIIKSVRITRDGRGKRRQV
jgi:hypothetical protein